MDQTKPKILYIAPAMSTFIKTDIRLLSSHYEVLINTYSWNKKKWVPMYLLHQLGVLLTKITSLQAIVVSFGGYWAFLPALVGKIFDKPVFIILNGTDCADLPQMNYGSLGRPLLRRICYYSYKWATKLLPVSESLVYSQNTYYGDKDIIKQGYKQFFPDLKTPYQVLFNGLDTEFWQKEEEIKRESKSFITVMSAAQFILKGGDLICEVAQQFPDCQFFFAGFKAPPHGVEVPENVNFLGRLTPEELRQYYSQCTYYLQLSIIEGFGCALSEAMLCECVPIGSSVNFIPGIIGESGFILEKRDVKQLEVLLKRVLEVGDTERLGRLARRGVVERFSTEQRQKDLLEIIKSNN